MLTFCNNCKKDFKIDKMHKRIFLLNDERITEIYFSCPHCEQKYTSAYENKKTIALQKKINQTTDNLKLIETRKIIFEDLQFKVMEYLMFKDELTKYNNTFWRGEK